MLSALTVMVKPSVAALFFPLLYCFMAAVAVYGRDFLILLVSEFLFEVIYRHALTFLVFEKIDQPRYSITNALVKMCRTFGIFTTHLFHLNTHTIR